MFGNVSGWGGVLDIEKALDSTTSSGQALIPQIVNPYIIELAKQHAPIRSMIPRPPWKSGTYDRNKRTAYNRARFIADSTSAPEGQSTYVRFQEPLKILQAKGGVSGFMQAAGQELIDANRAEIDGSTISATYEEEWGLLYANKYADSNQWSGLEQWSQTGSGVIKNADGAAVSSSLVDYLIDTIQTNTGSILTPSNSFMVMSFAMQSKLSATLQSAGQRWNDTVLVPGGFRLQSYRNIPILPTSFVRQNQAWAGSTVTATGSASGGSVADGTYKYYVCAVLLTGETLPCAEASGTVSGGSGNGKVTLVWTAIPDARLYKIYRTAANGASYSEKLYTVIPANVYYDAVGLGFTTPYSVDTWVDTGVRTTQTLSYNGGSTTAYAKVTGAAYTPSPTAMGGAEVTRKFAASNNCVDLEDIWLCTTGAPGVEGGTLEIPTLRDMSYLPLAKIADKEWFLIVQYAALIAIEQFQGRLVNVKTSGT